MKEYLLKNKPKITIYFILVLLVSNLIVLTFSQICNYIVLFPSNLGEPINYYRLFTYPLSFGGLIFWLFNAVPLLIYGYMIEHRLKTKDLISLIIFSGILGGLTYMIFNQNIDSNCPMAGPVMIIRAYWAVVIITGIKFWKTLFEIEKIILVIAIIGTIGLWSNNKGFILGQIVVMVFGVIFSIVKIKK